MSSKKKGQDRQTISLFITLALITIIFVMGIRWVWILTTVPALPELHQAISP